MLNHAKSVQPFKQKDKKFYNMKEGRSRDAVYSLKNMKWVRRDDMKIPRNIFIYIFNQSFIVLIFVLIVLQ